MVCCAFGNVLSFLLERKLSGDVKDRPPQAAVVPTCFKGKNISLFVIRYYVILMQQADLQG